VHGGHYFVLIKPHPESKWYKFDDDRVTPVTDREVSEDNFGGELIINGAAVNGGGKGLGGKGGMKRFTNAYMLVYVRESAAADILAPITQADTPTHLSQFFFSLSLPARSFFILTPHVLTWFRISTGEGAERARQEKKGEGRDAPLPYHQGNFQQPSKQLGKLSSGLSSRVINDCIFP
jgi:hypothetical protein